MPFTYEYPRPAVTVDVAVFARQGKEKELRVLLIVRKHAPFEGRWALPGGFVDENESLEAAAHRELEEETGLTGLSLRQVAAFGDPGRDPRGHTVSIAFVTTADEATAKVRAGDDAASAEWHPWSALDLGQACGGKVPLAFDHAKVLLAAKERLDALFAD